MITCYNKNQEAIIMKHYEKLIELGCFSRNDLIAITGSDAAANSLIHDYLKKGFIERVRRDLYTVISIETKQPIPTRYQIASRLFDDACVSHHSAFEYYGYANQVFYEIYVTTQNRFQSFEYDGVTYHRIASRYEASAELSGDVRVTGLERTVIDSINDFEKIGGSGRNSALPDADTRAQPGQASVYTGGI